MTKNYFSVRITDPDKCSEFYATVDVGAEGGMKMTTCIPKEHADEIKGDYPTKNEWRKYGITQRYLVPKENVVACNSHLCGINKRGERELESIETKGKRIQPLFGEEPDTYQLVEWD